MAEEERGQSQVRMLKLSQSRRLSPFMECAVSNGQLAFEEMMGAEGLKTKDVELQEEEKVMNVVYMAKSVALFEYGPQVNTAFWEEAKSDAHCTFVKPY